MTKTGSDNTVEYYSNHCNCAKCASLRDEVKKTKKIKVKKGKNANTTGA